MYMYCIQLYMCTINISTSNDYYGSIVHVLIYTCTCTCIYTPVSTCTCIVYNYTCAL